jgi:hypothetical protein
LKDIVIQDGPCIGKVDVFVGTWGGTVDGCKTTGSMYRYPFIETYDDFFARVSYDSDSSDNEYCEDIPPQDPVDQVNPFGKYICGTQANHNFESAKRPEITGECPSGYVMCSANTSKDTGICVLES